MAWLEQLRAEDVGSGPLTGEVVQWIVPYSPGGGFDTYSRLLEPFLERALGAQVVVKNMTGGGGIVAARWLMGAAPDGRTLALVNAPGLLVASLLGIENVPDPMEDFTVLARVTQDKKVWAVGKDSAFHSIQDLLDEAERRPISFGITGVGSPNFTGIVIASHLLGFSPAYVSGFRGSREVAFSAIRGEIDAFSLTFESVLDLIDSGDIRPLLQLAATPISTHRSLTGVPVIGGANGEATRVARHRGRDLGQAQADAATLVSLMAAGRLVVAPLGLEADVYSHLEEALHGALIDPGFVEAARRANRPLDVARSVEARAEFEAAAGRLEKFIPVVAQAVEAVRR